MHTALDKELKRVMFLCLAAERLYYARIRKVRLVGESGWQKSHKPFNFLQLFDVNGDGRVDILPLAMILVLCPTIIGCNRRRLAASANPLPIRHKNTMSFDGDGIIPAV